MDALIFVAVIQAEGSRIIVSGKAAMITF